MHRQRLDVIEMNGCVRRISFKNSVLGIVLAVLAGCGDDAGRSGGDAGRSPQAAGPPIVAPAAVAIPGWTLAGSDERPRQSLRGYGDLAATAATYSPAPGRAASYLRITAADQAHARLVLAKYRTDLEVLGGTSAVAVTVGGRQLPATDATGQGRILAVTAGSEVLILAAQDPADLDRLAQAVVAPLGTAADGASRATVPAWLDAWDRHGFRFYYRPWESPKGVPWKDYDVLQEFDFARRQDTGLVQWATPSEIDTQAGGTNRAWWDFARIAQTRRGQPWVLNTSNGVPGWILNRHPGDIQQGMPQFSGGSHRVAESWCASSRSLSWSAQAAKDEQLAVLQRLVRESRGDPLLLEYLEPHGELAHGKHDVLLEYGPAADRTFRAHLKARYGTVAAVAKRWGVALSGWDDVHVPELASFLGFDARAIDLRGTWRIAYEPDQPADAPKPAPYQRKPVRAPDGWFAAACDDASWPAITAPGNDLAMLLPHKPAVMRRSIDVPAAWLAAGPRTWLYVWDLNSGEPQADVVATWVNGIKVGDETTEHATPHWGAYEVTAALAAGANTIALRLPQGLLGYRVYLSHVEPAHYPRLGAGRNAQWVDFTDWRTATRIDAVRRGMAMIRGADPERPIINMAPDAYYSQIKELCEDYGGRFHNTGHMGGFWNDYLPMLMRGSDLPFSLEPGGPARDLAGFKHMMGLYLTEGVQAVHYFIHIGDVLWNPEIRTHFERIRPLLATIGKLHPPKAEVAVLLSDRADQVGGFPWRGSYDDKLPGGYWAWRISDAIGADYHIDALTDRDFARGNADRYRVVVDTNTTVMDEATVAQIEAFVRRGGVFVTFVQTGRHTPERPDSWPITRLTGYEVVGIDPHNADGEAARTRRFEVVGGNVFRAADWPQDRQNHWNGLSLRRAAPECQDLLRWADGTVAAGLRRIGSGAVVHLGLKLGRGSGGGGGEMVRMIEDVLAWAKVARLPAAADGVMLRHSVANNGLWDAWTLFNTDRQKTVATSVRFAAGTRPVSCRDVLAGDIPLTAGTAGAEAAGLAVEPLETRMLLTPRGRIAAAPLAWLDLQRAWWRAVTVPERGLPVVDYAGQTLDLADGWACRVLPEADTADQSALAAPGLDDAAWPRRRLGAWAVPEELPSRHVMLRRTFAIPSGWAAGRTTLWLKSWFYWTMAGRARYWLDGKDVTSGDGRDGLIAVLAEAAPGSRHVLAVEIRGEGTVCGPRGDAWLAFDSEPAARIDLAGTWTGSPDLLRDGPAVALPGPVAGQRLLRRDIAIPAAWAGRQTWIHIEHGGGFNEVLVNGHYARRHHHGLGPVTDIDIAPWVLPGADNRIEVVAPGNGSVSAIELRLR